MISLVELATSHRVNIPITEAKYESEEIWPKLVEDIQKQYQHEELVPSEEVLAKAFDKFLDRLIEYESGVSGVSEVYDDDDSTLEIELEGTLNLDLSTDYDPGDYYTPPESRSWVTYCSADLCLKINDYGADDDVYPYEETFMNYESRLLDEFIEHAIEERIEEWN